MSAPDPARLPPQVPYIIGNEACERFSFYGMRNILVQFLISSVILAYIPEGDREGAAKDIFHSFVIGVYFFPLLGGWLADRFFGKYDTVLWFSLIYCAGHACLAMFDDNRHGFYAGLFLIAALYVWFKQAFGLASDEDFAARGMIERTIVTQVLFLLGWLLGTGKLRVPRIESDLLRQSGTMLTAVAAARLLWFDVLLHNPAWTAQWVGPLPVLNLILPAYLLSAFWLYSARRRADVATRSGFWLAAFLAALITGVALLVRQLFQGPFLDSPGTPIAEFYVYSLAGVAVSIALLVAGIRLPDKALRLAGLLLLTATILKVFLVDASELEGILRILSFLGLGIALIGIARIYGPVLRAEAGRRTEPLEEI